MLNINFKPNYDSLCSRCTNAHIMQDKRGDIQVYCRTLDRPIHRKLTDCTAFSSFTSTDVWEMRKQAWILEYDKGNEIGFTPYRKWRKEHESEEILPGQVW